MLANDIRARLDALLDLEMRQGFLSEADKAEASLLLKELEAVQRQAQHKEPARLA